MRTPKPLPADEAVLIEAWHGNKPAIDISRGLGIREYSLDSAWRRLKAEGKLPDAPRPRTRVATYRPENFEIDYRADLQDGSAELLRLLKQEHGEHGRPDLFPGSERSRR